MTLVTAPLGAQGFTVTGDVARGGAGGGRTPVAGRWAVLHRVTAQGGAPIDSIRTDRDGRFRFRLAAPDTAAVYLASTEWHGVGYFTAPVRLIGRPADTLETLVVWDTSSTGPPIRLVRRLTTIARLDNADGTFDVLEVFHIENRGVTARVSDDTARPVWSVTIPRAAIQFQAREGDVSPDAVVRRGDQVGVHGTIAPGGIRQVSVTYALPRDLRTVEVPVDQPTGQVDLLIEGDGADVTGPTITALDPDSIEGRVFRRFATGALDTGAVLTVTLPAARAGVQRILPFVVAALVLAFAGGAWVALRPRRGAASA
ncbi:MAG TPA: hypothetical protein VD707_00310 [Gemmatimonadales bacterium]|nr:hypothetical protein [Gemmatimonadales bacterium]